MVNGILHEYRDLVESRGLVNLIDYECGAIHDLYRELGDARKMECVIAEIKGRGTIVANGVGLSKLGIDKLTALHEQLTQSSGKRPRQGGERTWTPNVSASFAMEQRSPSSA